MKGLSRSTALKIAAVLSAVLGTLTVLASLPLIARGASVIAQSNDSPPYVILILALVTGIIAIVAAFGTWKRQRWGIILTILVNLVNGLGALPGIQAAPTPLLTFGATATVIASVLIIVLCLWRERQSVVV
jgi:uncharacterized membrane protein